MVTTLSTEYTTAFGFTEQEVFDALDEFELSVQKGEVKARYDGFEDFIKSVLLYVGVGLGISLITFIFKVKQDELKKCCVWISGVLTV